MKLGQRIFLWYYVNKFKTIALFSTKKAAESAFTLFCTPYTRRRTYTVPPIFDKAEKLNFELEGEHIKGFTWKPAVSNAKKIIICHGFDSFSYRFDRYIEPLLEQGFEIFAFDAPAHGLSSGKTINALIYRNLILKASNLFGPFDAMVAHSFGGIAVTLAVEKLESNLPDRLVLIAPATETTRSVTDFCRYLKISPAIRTELEKLIEKIGGSPVSWYSVARVVKFISIPTLWVHDLKDKITPYEDMHHLTELKLNHVTFEITEGLGHSLYNDDAVAEKIVHFLAN
jgi:alpha-beta hydrolase superfamily lysophospholipase